MNIHEYQAKALFRDNNVPVPRGYLVHSGVEAEFALVIFSQKFVL